MEQQEETQVIKKQAQDEKYWDDFSSEYDQHVTRVSTQPFITLCTQTNAYKSSTILQKGGVLVSCDFSGKMMELTNTKFQESEWGSQISGNSFNITPEQLTQLGDHSYDLENQISKYMENEHNRFFMGCQANNESLPFKNDTFDCYIANLSLMIVDNHVNQLSEAYRVCKRGSKFGFSVWGREENNNNFKIVNQIFEKYQLGPKVKPTKTNFHICQNQDQVKKEMEDIGYTNIKMWLQPMNFPYQDFNDYWETMFARPTFVPLLAKLSEDERKQMKQDTEDLYDQLLGKDAIDPNCFELLIIIAEKQ
ncbi:coq5 family protein [Stylonychia lemnae]|uniref:Coq5 family protein n=1 Tax=Stylonychia lemnae TaxID=5949 RepID=A0A078AFY5_STYLE|nr:coq5 family protein [Stylonychia lemnae]|eukprot:CDW79798.1 coq5 family protein [Stylonychia lemnae]